MQFRLLDVAVVVLVQNEGTQARTEMRSAQLRRAGRREYPAVRGRPAFEQEEQLCSASSVFRRICDALGSKGYPI